MKPIIAAFDDHEHADHALRWAAEYARLSGAPLRVVNIFEPAYSEIAPDWMDELVRRRESVVADVLADVDATDAEVVTLHGSDPVDVLTGYVENHSAEMVVVGSLGNGGPGGLGARGPAHHLIHHAASPVAVVRPGYRSLEEGHVVVGVDGASVNSIALGAAERLARCAHGDLHAVFAYDPMDDTYTHPDGWHRHSGAVREHVDEVHDVDAKLYMAAGHPTEVLIEHADREAAAAIVVGTRGHGGFEGLRVGRVPVQLIEHATCPVIVVPH